MYKLRELERKDITIINSWRNNINVVSSLGAPFRFINQEVDLKWFDNYMQSRLNIVRCAVVTEESDDILGLVTLADINYINRSATLHLIVGESAQNKGVGTFAVQEICQHAFFNYGLHRIELNVLASNQRAIHVYEKCGFIREGLKKEAIFKNGLYVDMAIYALINTTIK